MLGIQLVLEIEDASEAYQLQKVSATDELLPIILPSIKHINNSR